LDTEPYEALSLPSTFIIKKYLKLKKNLIAAT